MRWCNERPSYAGQNVCMSLVNNRGGRPKRHTLRSKPLHARGKLALFARDMEQIE